MKNTDVKEFDFTALLHTYFMVENIASLNITGLEHVTGHDQLTNSACSGPEKITIGQNVDSIFKNTDKEIKIVSDHGKVTLYRKDLPGNFTCVGLRVVQIKTILFFKSMSEKVGSDIERLCI